ncbi:MAG TPA: AarF/UbiB family protein [Acidimicrobiales bacterium]|jgi:predicted unusual protein kinase regulating ubiquinone biosynthesis (AarF/ABC1/UbiB family)|nr:AarF/UbiB family protein [Acidimicrobiales bacterium]
MALTLRPQHLRRYRDIARLLIRHGGRRLVRQVGLDAALQEDDEVVEASAAELADDLEAMGPTFIKLGQLLSTRADLVSGPYADALSRLQDDVAPFPYEEVERIVEEELGVRISKAFASFDPTPLASASLGQVHRAEMRDGRQVAVKVQRPGIRPQIAEDMDVLAELAQFADEHTDVGRRYGFSEMLEQFRHSLEAELDYRREASNLVRLRGIVSRYDRLVIPAPIPDFTTSVLLTMEYVDGKKVTDLGPLRRLDLDGERLAEQLFQAYLDQILVEGFFHADPHPGNVLLTTDGRLALLDVGMVARIPKGMRQKLVRLLLALSEGDGQATADITIDLGTPSDGFDRGGFTTVASQLVESNQGLTMSDLDAGTLVMEIMRASGDHGLRLPPELSMLGKALLNLDQVARTLDPDFEPDRAIKAHAGAIMEGQMRASSGSVFTAMLEARDFAQQFPSRVNRVMDALAEGEFRVNVHAFDEAEMLRGLQKLANRLTMGLVLAALIVGAAMLMRVPTTSTLFGYPAIAIVCFLIAASAGLVLVVSIMRSDRRIKYRTERRK